MTKEEIMKLEVGREMDALVAEKIIGWKWFIGQRMNLNIQT